MAGSFRFFGSWLSIRIIAVAIGEVERLGVLSHTPPSRTVGVLELDRVCGSRDSDR